MRKVFSSHQEVAHVWASRSQDEGRASSMFFYGDTIYSYGRHFPIAKFETITQPDGSPKTVVLFTTRGYSVSTSKHINYTRRAIPSYTPVVYVHNPEDTLQNNLEYLHAQVTELLIAYAQTNHHGRKQKLARIINQHVESARAVCDAVYLAYPEWTDLPEDMTQAAKQEAEVRAERYRKAAEARAKEQAQRARKAKAYLKDWINDLTMKTSGFGAPDLYSQPIRLRVHPETPEYESEIETSHGARVPTAHAVKLWPVLRKWKETRQSYAHANHSISLGHYTVQKFDGKELVVGCHHIPWSELRRIAEQLGL